MGLMRSVLLWASRNPTLHNALPKFGFVKRAVKRFMPGEEIDDALNAAEGLRSKQIPTLLTLLGENFTHEEEAVAVCNHYLDVLERVRQRGFDAEISLKPTQLGLDLSEELCERLLLRILDRAAKSNSMVWVDMESSEYVDRTLSLFMRARASRTNVGLCLQAYLYRTAADLHMLMPLAPSIRLVKGAYAEPSDRVFPSKRDVDENFFMLAMELLMAAKEHGARLGIATHDIPLLRRIDEKSREAGIDRCVYEIQMLYGIQSEEQVRLVREGYRVRVLISYGSYWFPWYMRRLAERPANVAFVVKHLFTR